MRPENQNVGETHDPPAEWVAQLTQSLNSLKQSGFQRKGAKIAKERQESFFVIIGLEILANTSKCPSP